MLNDIGKGVIENMLITSLWANGAVEIEGTLIRVGINSQCSGIIGAACNRLIFAVTSATIMLPTEMPAISFCLKDLEIAKKYAGPQFRDFLEFIVAHEIGHIMDCSRRADAGEDVTDYAMDESFADSYAIQVYESNMAWYDMMLAIIEDVITDELKTASEGGLVKGLLARYLIFRNHKIFLRRKDGTIKRMNGRIVRDNAAAEKIETIVDFLIQQMDDVKNEAE